MKRMTNKESKVNFIKSSEEIDNIVREMEELINEKGAKAIIEESISLEDFNKHTQKLLQEQKNV